MQDLLGRALRAVQRDQPLELRAVVAVQAHDLPPREHLPVVVRGVVAELQQPPVRVGVAVEAGVEVDLGPARALAERPQHPLQVADPHVVADERVVLAAERLAGELQVARRGLERLGAVEALVDPRPLGAQLADLVLVAARALAVDPAAEPGAAARVDLHLEQVGRGAGQDLGEPDGALDAVGGDGVVAARALEEDEPLERVRVHPGGVGGVLDPRPPAVDALRALGDPAGRERVEQVARALRGARDELVLALGVPGEGVRQALLVLAARGRRDGRDAARRAVAEAGDPEDPDGREQDRGQHHGDAEPGPVRAGAERGWHASTGWHTRARAPARRGSVVAAAVLAAAARALDLERDPAAVGAPHGGLDPGHALAQARRSPRRARSGCAR